MDKESTLAYNRWADTRAVKYHAKAACSPDFGTVIWSTSAV